MNQARLWYDTPELALHALVDALGGFKRVAGDMWPTLPIEEAARKLADCLNPQRAHKLALSEIAWLLAKGRAADCHVAMAYFAESSGYAAPVTVEPEDEFARAEREFSKSVEHLTELAQKLERARELVHTARSTVVRRFPGGRAA